ncbi:MAG: hypothetical protein J6A07_04300 [Firmicutes bacterium]|nr:hypothetical protein [Bacillota bacterium]
MAKTILKETDMYDPIKRKFERLGYTVRSEVKDCDIVAVKGEETAVVEMKMSFNITVVYQAMDRRSITPNVYVAIPRPSSLREKNTSNMIKLLTELGIGLITVGNNSMKNVDLWLEPKPVKKVSKRRSEYIKKEFDQRTEDRNTGGSTGKKIVTAYKEASVLALCHLEVYGKIKVREIKKLGYPDKMKNALNSNVFGWFERSGGSGREYNYGLSVKGLDALEGKEYKELIEFYRKEVNKNVQDRQE